MAMVTSCQIHSCSGGVHPRLDKKGYAWNYQEFYGQPQFERIRHGYGHQLPDTLM
jgi:hypothetical protein